MDIVHCKSAGRNYGSVFFTHFSDHNAELARNPIWRIACGICRPMDWRPARLVMVWNFLFFLAVVER